MLESAFSSSMFVELVSSFYTNSCRLSIQIPALQELDIDIFFRHISLVLIKQCQLVFHTLDPSKFILVTLHLGRSHRKVQCLVSNNTSFQA
jgi:hypothetical protein